MKARENFNQANEAAARLILENPAKFGGTDGFPAIWARLFMKRLENEGKLIRPGRRESAA